MTPTPTRTLSTSKDPVQQRLKRGSKPPGGKSVRTVPFKARGGPRLTTGLHQQLEATVPFTVWYKLMSRMLELIGEAILDSPLGFVLPAQLGMLVVNKIKLRKAQDPRTKFIDYKHLCQTGEIKKQLNLHTFGHTYRIEWVFLRNTNLPTRKLYQFKACRSLNRALAQKIFAGQDYLPYEQLGLPSR